MQILNVKIQKEVNCYLFNAYFLCIILACDNMRGWFFENYIQLYFCPDKKTRNDDRTELFLDFYGGWTEPRKLLACESIKRNALESTDIIHYIESKINEGLYIYTYLDEYYTINKHREHNCHDIFIYGFDKKKKKFYVIGFDAQYAFTGYCLSYSTFKKAFTGGIRISASKDIRNGEDYCRLIRPKFNEKDTYQFSMNIFLTGLYDYLFSVNTARKNNFSDTNHDVYNLPANVFGISVYDEIVKFLIPAIDRNWSIDYRPIHTMYEHKSIMRKRLQFLFPYYQLVDHNNYTQQCLELENTFNRLRLQILKYNTEKKPNLISSVIETLIKQKTIEHELYSGIYTFFGKYN